MLPKAPQSAPKIDQTSVKNRCLGLLGTKRATQIHFWSIFQGCILVPIGASKDTEIYQKSVFWVMWCPRSSHMTSGAKLHKMVIDSGAILAQLRCPKWSKNALYFVSGFYLSFLFRVPSFSGSTTFHAVVKQLLYQKYVLSSRGPNFALQINVLSVPLRNQVHGIPRVASAKGFVRVGLRNWCPLKDLWGLGFGIDVRLRICEGWPSELMSA